jgi:transposase, IS30 family
MGRKYKQISVEERSAIAVGLSEGFSMRAIARMLKRPHSTIMREISRNGSAIVYAPHVAQARCRKRKRRQVGKLVSRPGLWTEVQDMMRKGWSPEQVSGKLKRMYPNDPEKHVSHETIYAHIYAHPRGGLRTELIKLLRKSHKTRRPRSRGKDRRGQLKDITPIAQRPKDVETRAIPGHWEGDLIKGKYNRSSVGTLVERTSRYVILVKLENATAPVVHQGFVREMSDVPELLRKSLTYDRGREMALHKQVAADLNLTVYFADPHAPWQRGSNENTNGLVREYLPKGSDLSAYSQAELNDIADRLNTRPRKKLDFLTPKEVYSASLLHHNLHTIGALHP